MWKRFDYEPKIGEHSLGKKAFFFDSNKYVEEKDIQYAMEMSDMQGYGDRCFTLDAVVADYIQEIITEVKEKK